MNQKSKLTQKFCYFFISINTKGIWVILVLGLFFFFFSLLVDQESEQRGVKLGFGRHVGPLPQPEDPLRRREEQTLLIQSVLKDKTRKQRAPPYLTSPDICCLFHNGRLNLMSNSLILFFFKKLFFTNVNILSCKWAMCALLREHWRLTFEWKMLPITHRVNAAVGYTGQTIRLDWISLCVSLWWTGLSGLLGWFCCARPEFTCSSVI